MSEETTYQGVSTDSRGDCQGKVFIALKGERFDGHRFVDQAMEKGAVLAVTSRPVDHPHILVDNTLCALHQIAALVRSRLSCKVVAITGSNGKTTTKEMLKAILSTGMKVHTNPGNLNNLVGMPLTLANPPADTEALVLEMGTNQPGELTILSQIARPHVAVITTIGQGHLGPLGGPEGVKQAKMEILKGVEQDGWLVTNAENPRCREIAFEKKLTFGLREGDIRAEVLEQTPQGSRFFVCRGEERALTEIGVPGTHHIYNALAAIGAATLVWPVGLKEIVKGLTSFSPPWGRCSWEYVNGVMVMNDAYNSNPDSLEAALRTIASMGAGSRVAVVGDMLELGEYEREAHRRAGRLVAELGIDLLCTYGDLAAVACEEAKRQGVKAMSFNSHGELADFLRGWLKEGDVVLVKGSRGMEMEKVIDELKKEEP